MKLFRQKYQKKKIKDNKNISHIAFVHCETSSGILNPLDKISNLCKKYKKKLIVDAMSTFSGLKNEVETLVSLRVNKIINKMNLVKRDEFEYLKIIVQKSITDNE